MKRVILFSLVAASALAVVVILSTPALKAQDEADQCVACHREKTPFIVADWESSAHAKAASKKATCQKCHGTEHTGPENKQLAKMPTASTCKACHIKQFKQYEKGKHAIAWEAMNALPMTHKLPKELTRGLKGCGGCHKIGQIGAAEIAPYRFAGGTGCSACHGKHSYSLEDAKDPEQCAACHVGFDHPQWEMWKHSKHGLAYKGAEGKKRAPTCQTCHMPGSDHENITAWSFLAVRVQEEDEGWKTDRAEILKAFGVIDAEGKPTALFPLVEKLKLARTTKEEFDALREKQITTCRQCHSEAMVRERFTAYDQVLREADRIFAKAIKVVAGLYKDGLIKQREGTPVKGYPFVLDFYDVNTAIEQKLFFLYEEYRNRTYQGAFHDNWDYMHWEGYSKMRKALVEIEEKAADMRAKAK